MIVLKFVVKVLITRNHLNSDYLHHIINHERKNEDFGI